MDTNNIVKFVDEPTMIALAERIVVMLPRVLPNASQLNADEALALAQVALLHNLSPFNGEIWFLKGNNRSLGIMPGIKGYRKHARRQAARISPSNSYSVEYEICSPDEALAPDGSVCIKAILRVASDTENYLRQLKMGYDAMNGSGATFKQMDETVRELIGRPPLYTSFGVIRPDEFKRFDDAHLNKLQQAKVRAERGAIRLRFDLDMGQQAYEQASFDEVDILDALAEDVGDGNDLGTTTPPSEVTKPVLTPAERKAKAEKGLAELGFEK